MLCISDCILDNWGGLWQCDNLEDMTKVLIALHPSRGRYPFYKGRYCESGVQGLRPWRGFGGGQAWGACIPPSVSLLRRRRRRAEKPTRVKRYPSRRGEGGEEWQGEPLWPPAVH